MLPKSLHTVTVLVNVARECDRNARMINCVHMQRARDAVNAAMQVLGYPPADTADAYGLADRAVAILAKAFRQEA